MCQIYIVAVTHHLGKLTNREDVFLVNIINNMCSVILFFRVLCNFVFPGVLSFSWPVRHFHFPLMKKKTKNYLSKMFYGGVKKNKRIAHESYRGK